VARDFQPEDFARFHPGGSLGRKLLTRVADVMHKDNLPICSPQDSFRDVVHVINRGRLGLALVMEGQALKGLITDGDVRRAFDSDHDYKTLTAAQIMSIKPKSVSPEMRFAEAEDLMRASKINALVVKDADTHVVGVLQIYDLNNE
jgi:arabinose-5-phosphate isomerase